MQHDATKRDIFCLLKAASRGLGATSAFDCLQSLGLTDKNRESSEMPAVRAWNA